MLEGAEVAGGGRRHLALVTSLREREMGCGGRWEHKRFELVPRGVGQEGKQASTVAVESPG